MEPWQPQPAPDGSANFRFNDYCPNRKNVNPNRMKSVPPAPYAVGAVNHAVAIGDARFAVACEERSVVQTSELPSLNRTSSAVFCLHKKNNKRIHTQNCLTHSN